LDSRILKKYEGQVLQSHIWRTSGTPLDWARFMAQIGPGKTGKCSTCGQALLRCEDVPKTMRAKISIYKVSRPHRVQQGVRPDPAASPHRANGPPR